MILNIILYSDFSKPAFKFVSTKRFLEQCLWHPDICASVKKAAEECREETVKFVRYLLPKLASGWFRQRGNYFGFGDYDESSQKLLLKKDMEKLDKAETR